MHFSRTLKKLSAAADFAVLKTVTFLIAAMIITITMQILSRTLAQAFTWTEELSRYLLVWSTFLGATLAYKRGMHISVTFVADSFPEKAKKILFILNLLLSILFFSLAVYNGFSLMAMQIFQVSPAMQLPMRWIYLVIPASFIIMSIHALAMISGELSKENKS